MNLLKKNLRLFLLSFVCVVIYNNASGQHHLNDLDSSFTIINKDCYFFEDSSNKMSVNDVIINDKFIKADENTSYGLTNSVLWFKAPITKDIANNKGAFVIGIANSTLDSVQVYQLKNDSLTLLKNINRQYNANNPFFQLGLSSGDSAIYYFRVKSSKPLFIPIYISSFINNISSVFLNLEIFSIYLGIAVIMFFYNLFIYFTTKDKNYLYYILYLFFLVAAQICLQGYIHSLDNEKYGKLIYLSIPLATSLVGIFSTVFIKNFLELKTQMPWANKALNFFIFVYCIAIALTFFDYLFIAQVIIQANTVIGIVLAIIVGFIIQYKGYTPALYFNLSWSFFLISVVIFIMKDTGILPFTAFTNNSILIGSSIEILLLSFALADKINVYKKEKEESQAITLKVSQENERIIREQNVILEAKVNERTLELQKSNKELEKTLKELKETETQLVESEKMASLGQLTAGIAHEINNPINFVTSNVNPLRRGVDVLYDMIGQIEEIVVKEIPREDKLKEIDEMKQELDYDYLKTEIDYLLKGIGDGASRTAEIVKGLRLFSRLDEDDLKKADINEGLTSTTVIVNHLLNNLIEIEKEYALIPMVECYPGKLNQVFLNIMSNAIHAIHKRWGEELGGVLHLKTWNDNENVYVSIKDNGTGMDENTQKKLFEPFFTTKDVGEGTGLGLSIAYNTIKKHNGSIELKSALGEGTEFIITIPIFHKSE